MQINTIKPVHTAEQLIDVVLSKTQRKTGTIIRKNFKITRIRFFYMRKVKFTAQSFVEKIEEWINAFPRLNDIHPFYSDLYNVLYDKDHYKLALSQLNKTKHIIEKIAQDYVKLIKYADSLYRAKSLKISALGKMVTVVKKSSQCLEYLEQVR